MFRSIAVVCWLSFIFQLIDDSSSLIAAVRAQAVEGNNLQTMIAAAAQRYGARRHQTTDMDSCHCKGGSGNCAGCVPIPIHSQFHRQGGLNGRDGRPGAAQTKPLLPGLVGDIGSATTHVKYHDGTTKQYDSIYRLELVDFEVEDENGDGIFEPGEHVYIHRIRIRNTGKTFTSNCRISCTFTFADVLQGGMPSPKRPIPISIIGSGWLLPVVGEQGVAFVKSSIMPGITATLDTSLKVLIRPSKDLQPLGTRFIRSEKLAIKATMPLLNQNLPFFDYSRTIDIQYPIELRDFNHLPTMALGSMSRFSVGVMIISPV